ncbi:MAG: site-2 protease family protein, partial [Pseudomonadota bacterium]
WLVALVLHEFGHAYVAWKAGDHTVETNGYLSMDPLRYADVATSLVIPVIVLAIGGLALPGGAVYLREDLMRSAAWRSAASLAGPAGTLLMLILLAVALAVGGLGGWDGALWPAIALLALFQAMALVLNLLPVPGLDGWGVIRPFLPDGVRAKLRPVERWGIFVFIGALFFVPGVSSVVFGIAFDVASLFGVDGRLVATGYDAFEFWK